MTIVLGVDGCPAGWCAVRVDVDGHDIRPAAPIVYRSFSTLLDRHREAQIICVDIPIGLKCRGEPRECDTGARTLLGDRWPCVFHAPCRHSLARPNHTTASKANRECTGRGLSIQCFNITRKIREINDDMTPAGQDRVVEGTQVLEVHPELCFWSLNR